MDKTTSNVRSARMAEMYRSGMTLAAIGSAYGITRERVRQIVLKKGLTRNDGGFSAHWPERIEKRKAIAQEKRAVRALRIWRLYAINVEQYEELRRLFGPTSKSTSPIRRFIEQRRSAGTRKIAWQLTFAEWWGIWKSSGKYPLRGRGQGYCMARWGDTGPYSVDNVYICTIGENFSHSFITKPWRQRWPNGHPMHRHDGKCKRGHPLSGSNLYVVKKTGARVCKECNRIRHRKYDTKRRGSRQA